MIIFIVYMAVLGIFMKKNFWPRIPNKSFVYNTKFIFNKVNTSVVIFGNKLDFNNELSYNWFCTIFKTK